MKPRKAKDLIPGYVQESGCDRRLLEDLLDFSWTRVRKELSSLNHSRVFLKGLGTFIVKPTSLNKRLEKSRKIVEDYRRRQDLRHIPRSEYLNYLPHIVDLEKMEKMKAFLLEENVKRQEKYNKRRAHETDGNLEKPETDPGGGEKRPLQEGGRGENSGGKDGDL